MSELTLTNALIRRRNLIRSEQQQAKFKVGDIICSSIYPGRDHWQQVGQVIAVTARHYELRPLQSRTTEHDWTTGSQMGACYLARGGWEEEQTTLFHGKTLEQEVLDKESQIRQIVREELNFLLEDLTKRITVLENRI